MTNTEKTKIVLDDFDQEQIFLVESKDGKFTLYDRLGTEIPSYFIENYCSNIENNISVESYLKERLINQMEEQDVPLNDKNLKMMQEWAYGESDQ